jgi:hypothetical protein
LKSTQVLADRKTSVCSVRLRLNTRMKYVVESGSPEA